MDWFKEGAKYMIWLSATEFWLCEFLKYEYWGFIKIRKMGQPKENTTVLNLAKIVAVEEIPDNK